MTNLYVPLTEAEVARLRELAARERRGAKEQAAYLIVDGLRRAGLDTGITGHKSAAAASGAHK